MKKLLTLLIASTLTGCLATKQYRAAESACTQKALQEYPVSIEMQLATCYKNIQVPTGQTTCTSNRSGTIDFGYLGTDINSRTRTNCTSLMTTERIPYSCTQRVDTNLQARKQAIAACTTSSCYQMYGNAECETPKGLKSSSRATITDNNAGEVVVSSPSSVAQSNGCSNPEVRETNHIEGDTQIIFTCDNRADTTEVRCGKVGREIKCFIY